jgi:hypothetical protein
MIYREILVRLGLITLVVLAGELLVHSIQHVHAATIGYRIKVEVCGGKVCRPVRTPANLWGGEYACQGRAKLIQDEAVAFLNAQRLTGPRPSLKLGAKCVAVEGQKGA